MECVSAVPPRTKSPEILNNMNVSEPDQHLEKEETLKFETRAHEDEKRQEENQCIGTIDKKCIEGTKDGKETSVTEEKHSTIITDSTNVADSVTQKVSSNGEQAEGNSKWVEPAVEKSGITSTTIIPSNGDPTECNNRTESAEAAKSGIINATVIQSDEDQAEFSKWIEPVEKSKMANVTIIPSIGELAECKNNCLEPAVEKLGMTNAIIIPSSADYAECKNILVSPANERSEITNGAIIIPKQSEVIKGVVIPSKSDVIHDNGYEGIKTPANTFGKGREINMQSNMQSMNIVLREIEDTIDSSDKDNSSIIINNVSGKENYRSKNPHSNNELNVSKDEKICNCKLSITELGDRLIKLDLTVDDGHPLTSITNNFQKMNISAELEVSDEENASDDDNDSCSISDSCNDDQDTDFEGDDENDDDDYEAPFGKRAGYTRLSEKDEKRIAKELAEQEDEYISRNPIAQVKSNDRYQPYPHPIQISSEPIISADELIQNFTFSENEKNFLISLPPNLNIDTCPIDETQITNYQDTFYNGDKFRDIDELSMTSDLGRSVVADSPQSMPSPPDSYSDYENVDHRPDFCLNIPTTVSMPSMPSNLQKNTANHVPKKATVNKNYQFTYLPASNSTSDKSMPAVNVSSNSSINYNNQLTVRFPNGDGMSRKKPVPQETRNACNKTLSGGTVHVQKKPAAKQNVGIPLIERDVNVPHQVQVVLSQPSVNVSMEPRTTTRVSAMQPRHTTRVSPIQPRHQGPLLYHEQEMNRTAAERLQEKGRTKRKMYSPTEIEWINLLTTKPGQSPETKNFFFDFLNGNNKTHMEERVLAHSNYIQRALKNPEVFFMRDPVTGLTPLRLAAFNHNSKPLIARCIADYTVDTSGKKLDTDVDDKGETVLHKLACMGESHVEVLAELLHVKMRDGSKAFDVNKPNIDGMTPLMLAVVKNFKHSFHTVEQLIKHGARIEAEDKLGRNCLHYAVEKVEDKIVGFGILKKLLQSLHSCLVTGKLDKAGHYAAINKCDDQGYTPLHLAIKDDRLQINDQLKLIQLLKEFGSDTKMKCCGHLPLLLVENSDRKDIIKPHLQKTTSVGQPHAVK
ncbi:hypothetical protein LSTR_LSTR008146 [Laodelphax striatellus]|uniref:Uncharacterized protein n=1 Tax=Laodelphax striatellus TaxID=195883 RepID=A0A482WZT1_LAOST|nr:hypothetical protein LSTR_LSTR008146 [Laodelphax striatellus]